MFQVSLPKILETVFWAVIASIVLTLPSASFAAAETIPVADPEACVPVEAFTINSVWTLSSEGDPIAPDMGNLVASGDVILESGEELELFSPIFEGDSISEGTLINLGDHDLEVTVMTGDSYIVPPLTEMVIRAADPTHKAVCQCICRKKKAKDKTITLDPINGSCALYPGKKCDHTANLDGKVPKNGCKIVLVKC